MKVCGVLPEVWESIGALTFLATRNSIDQDTRKELMDELEALKYWLRKGREHEEA